MHTPVKARENGAQNVSATVIDSPGTAGNTPAQPRSASGSRATSKPTGSPIASRTRTIEEDLTVRSLIGKWEESKNESQSLEPILRVLGYSKRKIETTMRGVNFQSISLRGTNKLVTEYESEMGTTTDVHLINGGRQSQAVKLASSSKSGSPKMDDASSSSKRTVTECRLAPGNAYPLRIVTIIPLPEGVCTMKESRRVRSSGAVMEQKLELYPGDSTECVAIKRVWRRVPSPIDDMLRQYEGTWTVDELRSDSYRPFLEALNLPRGAIAAALALKPVHIMRLCGHNELLVSNPNLGSGRSVIHHVTQAQTGAIVEVHPGTTVCTVVLEERKLIYTSRVSAGTLTTTEECRLVEDGNAFEQQNTVVQSDGQIVVVKRRWVRVGEKPESFPADEPESKPESARAMASPPRSLPRLNLEQLPQGSNGAVSVTTPARPLPALTLPAVSEAAPSIPAVSLSKHRQLSWRAVSNEMWWLLSCLLLLIGSLLSMGSSSRTQTIKWACFVICVALRIFGLARSDPLAHCDKYTWFESSLILLAVMLIAAWDSLHEQDESDNELLILLGLCAYGATRAKARPRRAWSETEQWTALSIVYAFCLVCVVFGWPVLAEGQTSPGAGAASVFAFILAASLRWGAHTESSYGPGDTDSALSAASMVSKATLKLNCSVREWRQGDDCIEYAVLMTMRDGEKHTTWHRYSEFRSLAKYLREDGLLGEREDEILSLLPPKRWTNSSSVIEERVLMLNEFADALFKDPETAERVIRNHQVRNFVGAIPIA